MVSLIAYHAAPPGGEAALVADIGRHLKDIGRVLPGRGPVLALVPLPCLALPGMVVEIEAVAHFESHGASPARECFRLEDEALLPDTLSHALRSGDHLWAGAVDASEPGEGVERLGRVLASAGGKLSNLVKLNAWYRDDGTETTWRNLAEGLGAGFAGDAPVSSAMPTPSLAPAIGVRLWGWAVSEGLPRVLAPAPSGWRWPASLPFPRALSCGDLVFLGGHPPPQRTRRSATPGGPDEQTRFAVTLTRADLSVFGLGLDDMVKQTSFYLGAARAEDIVTNQRLRSSFYREPAGAATGVPLPGFSLPGVKVEIETIAMR